MTAASGCCTIAITPDQIEALLAGDSQVVDIEDREVGPPRRQQFRRVGRFPRHVDAEIDPCVAVETLRERRVDAGVGGVGGEIEHQRRAGRRARFSAAGAAAANAASSEAAASSAARPLMSATAYADRVWPR